MNHTTMVVYIMKNKKKPSKKFWTNREYHVEIYEYVEHQYVKMNCSTKKIPELPFLIRTTNHTVYTGEVSIITCVLVPNQDMENVEYIAFLKCVLYVHQHWINLGPQVCHQNNNHIINLPSIAYTAHTLFLLKTGT